MSSIDTRVVEAKFKNDEFGKGVDSTMGHLDRLKAGLKLEGATDGLKGVSDAAGKFDSSSMESGAGRIGSAFSAASAMAFGALASIGAKAASVGAEVVKSFTLQPLMDGFSEYETKIGSTQTILANTAKYGTSLDTVNKSLDDLNTYADKTIYSFGDMTKNIGLFTNSGIKVEDATKMIKGFSNAAAASGTNAQGASNAAFQLSQGLSAGKITAQDWISLTNVGMGNSNMKDGLIEIAKASGTFKKAGIPATAAATDFKGSLEKGWLSADVMSKYLNIMSGDMDVAKMKSMGLSDATIKNFQSQAQTAQDAATKVRTFSQLTGTLKEAVGSGWSESFQTIFGDFNEATDLWTNVNNVIGGVISRSSDARNKMLKDWKDAGGRTALIEGLATVGKSLGSVFTAVGTAYRNIFPAKSGQSLADTTKAFADFVKDLVPSEDTIIKIVRSFEGLFAILHIGWTIIKAIAKFFFDMFAGIEEGNKGILDTTAAIGGFFLGLDEAISKGDGINKFFETLKGLLFIIINPLKNLGGLIGGAFAGVDLSKAGASIGEFLTALLSFGGAADHASSGADKVKGAFGGLVGMASTVAGWVGKIGKQIAGVFQGMSFDNMMKGLQTGGLVGLVAMIGQLAKSIKGFNILGGKGKGSLFSGINENLEQLSGTLKSMQNNNNASALFKLAAAIAILAVAVLLLASINPVQLAAAVVALGVLFVELSKGMAMFNKAVGIVGAAKINLIAAALILLAIAVGLLVISIKVLASMSWVELAKGLGSLALILGVLVGAVTVMSKNSNGVLKAAAAMLLMAVAIDALVVAVAIIGRMDTATLIQGLIGVGAILTELALFQKFAKGGATAPAQAAALVLMAAAIAILSIAVQTLGSMSWEDLARGLVGIGAALAIMAATLKIVGGDPKLILSAIAIAKVAGALGGVADVFIKIGNQDWGQTERGMLGMGVSIGLLILAIKAVEKVNFGQLAGLGLVTGAMAQLGDALKKIGEMSWDQILHGLVGLVGVIAVLIIALKALEKVPATAGLALGLVAGSLALLAPALVMMAAVPIAGIVGALVLLAGVFIILGVAAYVLAGSVPVLLGLGIAIALLGAAVFLAGAGLFLFAAGFTALGAAAAVGTAGVVAAVSALVGLIPMVLEQIGKGIVAFLQVIGSSGVAITAAITAILLAVLQAIIDVMPKLAEAITAIITMIITVLIDNVPRIIEAGFQLLMALLNGIASHIGEVITVAVSIVVNFLNGIAQNVGRFLEAGANVIIKFMQGIAQQVPRVVDAAFKMITDTLNGIADAIRRNSQQMTDAGMNIIDAIIDGVTQGVKKLGGKAIDAAKNLAGDMIKGAMHMFDAHSPSRVFRKIGGWVSEGLALGVDDNAGMAVASTENMGQSLLDTMGKTISGLGSLVGNMDELSSPVITPVLDLSAVQKDSSQIGDLLGTAPIDLSATVSKTSDASAGYTANQDILAELAGSAGTQVSFTQVNNSPKALSNLEIYRQTNNQLSQVKGALTNAN